MKNAWAWAIGIAVFSIVFAVWAWRLPRVLGGIGGDESSIGKIFSSFGSAGKDVSAGLANVSARLDENMGKVEAALKAEAAQAEAVEKLKRDLAEEAAKQKIKAAVTESRQPVTENQ